MTDPSSIIAQLRDTADANLVSDTMPQLASLLNEAADTLETLYDTLEQQVKQND